MLAAASLAEAALLGLRGRHYPHVGRWLLATIPAAVVAELALGLVYDQSF